MHQFLSPCATTDTEAVNESMVSSHEADTTLACSLDLMQGIVAWLIKAGVGYAEFSSVLKPLFYNAAIDELDTIEQKKTDSSMSLISGLHRRDVSEYKQENKHQRIPLSIAQAPMNLALRVLQLWQTKKYPNAITVAGEYGFDALVNQISTEKHPRSVLFEMKRLKMLTEENGMVYLKTVSSASSAALLEQKQDLVAGVKAQLNAGLKNLFDADTVYLQGSIAFEHLSINSVHKLNVLSADLWDAMQEKLRATADECLKKDAEHSKAIYSFRAGTFGYFE